MSASIIARQADQLNSQFRVIFPEGIPGSGDASEISLRIKDDVTIPEIAVETYERTYRGVVIPKTGGKDATSKEISLNVVLDAQWKVFDQIYEWQKGVFNPNNGTYLSEALTRTTMIVEALDPNNTVAKKIIFKDVKLVSHQISAFNYDGSEPTELALNFVYVTLDIE